MQKVPKISYEEAKEGYKNIWQSQVEMFKDMKLASDKATVESVACKLGQVFEVIGSISLQEMALIQEFLDSMDTRREVRETLGAMLEPERAEYSKHFDQQGVKRVKSVVDIFQAMLDTSAIKHNYEVTQKRKDDMASSMGLV